MERWTQEDTEVLGAVVRAKDKTHPDFDNPNAFSEKVCWVFDGRDWCSFERRRKWDELQILDVKAQGQEDYRRTPVVISEGLK